jgi:type IV pilus assembly protein PilM
MDKHPVAWGLDLGHSSIKAVKLSRVGSTVTVLGYTIEPIIVAENGDRDEAMVKAMISMALREDFGNTPVLAALSGRQVLTRTVNIPTLNAKRVDRMVELEARQQIPGNFDEIEWGYHLSPASDGASNDVALFAVKRDLVEELISKSKQSGINLIGVSVSSLALYNFVRYDQVFPDDEAVIILDVGAENTDLVVYMGEALWMRTLAVSGNDITKAFMKKFRVSFEEAETLKRQTADSRQADKIIKVIESSLNELTAEVQRSLGFYKSQNTNAKLENLVISGSTFKLPGLPEYMAERLRYTVNILEDLDKINVASGLEREHFLNDLPSLGVAVGLALQATGVSRANVNLMPSDMQVQNLLKAKRWAAVAILMLLAISFTIYYFVVSNVAQENSHLTDRMKKSINLNKDALDTSMSMLNAVPTAAQRLQEFEVYGAQAGVVQNVLDGVTGSVEAVIKEVGPLGNSKDPAEGGDPYLQGLYLRSVVLKPYEASGAAVFHPLSEPREVLIEVAIVKPEWRPLVDSIQAKLKDLKFTHPVYGITVGKAIFTDVAVLKYSSTEKESFYYINKEHVNEKGDPDVITDLRPVPVTVATIQCTMSAETGK